MSRQHFTFDSDLELKDAGLVAASAAAQVDAAAKVLDFGSANSVFSGVVVIDVSALEIASNDEDYDIVIQFSSDSDFGTAANIQDGPTLNLAAKETKSTDSDKDDATGRYFLPFINEFAGTTYRYMRLYTIVAGTIATGINYTAYVGKM